MLDVHLLTTPRLLAGPALDGRPEPLAAHLGRLGGLPRGRAAAGLVDELEAAGLLGRGGAAFPVGRKWRALAERRDAPAVVVANGAEGEPASWKDRVLMTNRPHLVIDGAVLAADAIGADQVVMYVGGEHEEAAAVLRDAVAERDGLDRPRIRVEQGPVGYVAGEASAAVHWLNGGAALPTSTPPRTSQRGVAGRPTLVQNVESLAYAALVARHGADWYRSAGRGATRGTALVTVGGDVRMPGVYEIELGTSIAEVVERAGVDWPVGALLLGGYAGSWVRGDDAPGLGLDPLTLRDRGLSFGCGVVLVLPTHACGVAATARLTSYLARESAGQCGPCAFGLPAIASAMDRLAGAGANRRGAADLEDIARWATLVRGRGACHHPDGAAALVDSARTVFAHEFEAHARMGWCSARGRRTHVA